MKPPERILVRGLNWLGDAIIGTAALQRLRQARPQAYITLLSHEKLASLWQNQPFIDELVSFPRKQSLRKTANALRGQHYDIGLAFPNSVRSALELWLARIPRRVGYARPWRTWLLTDRVPPRIDAVPMHKRPDAEIRQLAASGATEAELIPATAHHIHDYLRLVAALGASPEPLPPWIHVTETEIEETRHQLGIQPAPDWAPWFGLNPGAEYGPAKRWPAERFVEAAIELHQQTNCRWLLFGGPADVAVTEKIAAEIQQGLGKTEPLTLNLAGKTNLRQLAAALKICRVVLTNDTGPMHLAAAVGTPVVVTFGSTSAELTGPTFSPQAQVLKTSVSCSPCFRRECPIDFRCMNQIQSAVVVEAALRAYGLR